MSDFTAHWHWPQWAIAGLILFDVVMKAAKHGQVREYNGFYSIVDAAIFAFILICGGFFA